MTDRTPSVNDVMRQRAWDSFITFLDSHPRIGWYIAVMSTTSVLLDLLHLVM